MSQFSSLFSPGKIGTLETKNRVVMPPMVRNYADEKGLVTPEYVAHIERIARGGVGTMILEASFIRQDGRGFSYQLGVHTDDCIPGLKQLVKAAQSHGAVIGPQIFHAGRQTTSKVTGTQPVAPSAIPDPTINEMPRSLKSAYSSLEGGLQAWRQQGSATLRGHKVVLFEERDRLGGALNLSAMIPQRPGWAEICDYLTGEMNRMGVDVRLGTRATAELARLEGAEVAIIAVGALQVRPDVPGIEQENVVLSRDILEGRAGAKGKNVVVIGSGVSGAQIADFLAEKGHDVAIVGAAGGIAESAAVVVRDLLLERLKQQGVKMLTNTKILGIEKGKVLIDGPSGTESLPADTVVVSLGMKPKDSIASELRAAVKQVIVVGDAAEPRDVTSAMVEGARAGLSI